MEAVNGDKGGPPPPSPLTGCYLLVVIGEPHSQEHKDIILQRVAKGLLSWDVNNCLVDLEKELSVITEQAPDGEEARYGERLIQFASENLVTEVLIHPVVSTLAQCVRNLLSSFTRHRHIVHAGYTFAANGSWILQDGTFSYLDFAEAFQEIDVQRVIRAYENSIGMDVHCSPEGDWIRLPKESFIKGCNVRLNPNDVLTSGSPAINGFINYLCPFLVPTDTESLLESSDVVGNIRFSHPTLYIFPGGQGDAALFGINGFNMLLDGGFSRKACFWDFVRHLDRLDAVLLTRLNNSNIMGISSVLRRKKQNAVYPQIGHFFCNIREKKAILSPDGDKDKDPLLINLLEEGQDILSSLTHLNLSPQPCYRDSEPINLYHKVGHGTLDMYVLSPAKDSKELKDFLQKWNTNDQKLFANQKFSKELPFPLPNLVSICALLVWQPANPNEMITRILFPGSCPQTKVFEGLDRLKQLEFVKHPTCSESSLTPVIPIKSKTSIEKIIAAEIKPQRKTFEPKKTFKDEPKKILDNNKKDTENDTVDKSIKKSDSTESDKPAKQKPKKTESDSIVAVNGKSEEAEATKIKTEQKPKPKPEPKRTKPIEKKISPTAPKSSESKASDLVKARTALKASPGSTPAKSAKEANNRKVVESKYKQTPPKKDVKPEKKEVKPVVRRPKGSPLGKVPGSPLKKVNGVAKSEKKKLDKEGTTDSSTVSTPSADQESVLKKDISKLTPEEIANLKAEELAELKEEQEIVKEIEAVFKKGEQKKEKHSDMRKIKDLSSEEKEPEEYLIIEKEEIVIEDKSSKEDEIQKLTRDSEESEKKRAKQDETSPKIEETETTKPAITTETPKERSLGSQDDKIDTSGEKVDNKEAVAPESQPDEKISGTIESGATTAPTLPEDERITLDEIKEDQVIEEKHVKEETKEKDVPVVQVETKIVEPVSKLPPVVGIRLEKQPNMRDLVKTPDEVADLPMHEEVDIENYVDYQYKSDQVEDGRVKSDDSAGKKSKEVAEKPIEKQIEKKAEMVKGLSDQEAKEVTTWLEGGPQEDSGVFDNDVQEAKVSGIAIEEQKQEKVEEIVTETEVKTKESGTEKQVQNEMEGTKETIIEKTDIGKKEDVAQETKEESEEAVKLETKESVIASKDAEQIQGDSKIVSPKKGEEIIDDKHVSPVQEDDIKEAVTQDEHKTIDTETTKQIEFAEEYLKEEKQVKTELGKLEEVSNLQTGPRKESITTITPKEEGEVQGVQEIKLEEVAEKSSKEKETVEEDSNVLISSRKESISEMTVTKEAKQQETEEIKDEAVEQISNVQICPKKESVSQDSKQHEPQSIPPKEDKHEADDIKFTDDTNKILEEETTAKEVTHLQISSRKESIAEISKDLEQNEEKSVAPKEEHDIEETKLNEFLDKEITENELINSQIAGKKESNAEITKDLEEQQKSVSPKKEAKDQETEETKLKDEINTFLEKEKADETSNLQVCPRKESVAEVMHELEESDVSPLVNEVPAHYKISEQVVEDIKDGNKLSLKEAEHVKAEEVKIEEVSGLQICPRMESVAAIDKEAAIEVDKTEDLEAIAPKDLKGQDTYKHETESKQVMESQESKKIDDSELQSKEIPKDLHKADEKVVGSEVEQTIASVSQLDAKQEQEQEIKDEKFEEKRVEETTEKESERKLSLSHAGAHEGINEAEEKKEEALVSQEADLNKKKAETKSENIVESEKIEEKQDLEKEIIEEKEEKIKINETEKIVSDKKLVQDEKDDKDEKEKKDKKDVKDEVTHEQEKHATAESKIVAEAELKLESKIDAAESVQEIKEETIKTNETIKESEVKSKPEEVVEKLLDESDKNIKDTNVFEEFIASIDKEIEQTSTELQKSEIDKSKPDMEQIEKDIEKGIDQIKEDAKEAKQHIEEKMQKLGSDMEEIEQRVETFVEQTHEGAKQIQEHITNVIEAIQNESDQVKMHVDENIDNVKADIEQVEEKIDDIVAKDKSIDGKDVAKTVQDDILDVASGKIKDTLIESKQAGKYIEGIVREAQQEVKDFQANVDEVGKEVYKANDQIKEQIKETLDELSEMKVVEKNLEEMLEKEKEGAEFLEKRVEDIISEKEISSQIKADLKDLKNDLSDYIDTKHKEAKEMEEKIDNKMRQMSLEIANVQDVVSDVLQETKEESKQIEDGLHDFVKEKGDEISEKVDKLLSGAEALGDVVCGKMNELFGIESKKPDEQIQESEKPRKYSDKLAGETKVLSADVEKKFETHIQSTDEVKTEIVEAPSIKLSTTTSEVKKDEVEKFVEADTEKCDKPKEVDSSENASEEIIQNGFGGISPETEIEKLPKASSSDTKLSDELKEAEILLQKSTTEEKSESQKSFELSLLKQTELIDKAELGSKSPKEREEDVAKIVASVAEVLKSDAPLEEFEGKLPLTTLLRETHITTVDSPVTSQPPLAKELEPIDETKTTEEEQKPASESKRSSLIKDSAELMEATSKMISSIKSSKCESDNDPQTVHKMLVTASSEDGGEETVICPSGSIKFSKSSESSGRSTPDVTGDRKKSSATDSEVDKTEFSQDTVKEKDQDEATEKGEKDVKKLEEERHEMVKDESVKKIVDEEMRKIEVSGEAKEKSSTEDKEHVEEEKFKTESSEKEVEKQVEHKSEEVKDGGDVLKHKKLSEHDEHAQEEKIKSVTTEDVKKSDEKPIEDHSKSILEEVGRRSETVKEESVDSEHKKLSQDDEHVQEEKIKSVCTQEVKQAGEKLIEDHSKSIVEQADHKSEKIKDEGDDKKLSEDDEHVQEKKIKTVSTEEVKKSDEKPIEDHSKSILEQVDHKSEAVKEESLKHVSNDSEDKKLSEDKEIAEEEKIKSKITEEVKKPDETPTKDFRKSELEHIDHKIETTKEESLKPIEDDKRKSLSEDEEHVKEEKVKSASPEEIKKLDEVEDHKSKTTKEESFKAETLKSTEAVIVDVDPTKKQSEAITETKVATAEEKSEAPIPEKQHLQDDKQLAEKLKEDVIHVKTVSEKLEMLKSSEQPEVAGPSSSTPKLPKEDQDLSGKSTPDIAEVEKIKEMQEILKHEKHIPGSSTPPTAPASPIVKETPEESTKEDTKQASDYSDDEDDIPGSPASMTSQAVHSHSSSHYELDEDKSSGKVDLMNASLYGSLPQDEAPSYLHEITKAKYSSKETLEGESSSELMTASFIGAELPGGSVTDEAKEVVASWGKPLGLPSPAPPADNRGTPKKERKLPANVSAKNKLNDDRKRSESPSKYDKKPKKFHPVYVDLTYVPHNGNANYSFVDFFKRIRARYYVFSGIEPSKEVYNALLEAKQTWENNLEVTIIPTYDTDILGYWVAENEDLLTKYKIDLSPSASRCTINLQDHETSCSAYRLEF